MNRIDGALADLISEYLSIHPVSRASPTYRPSSLTNHLPPRRVRQRELHEPIAVDPTGLRWGAVRTAHACERRVADYLAKLGFAPYCPLARKFVFYNAGRRTRAKVIREFPVFSRYLFVGCPEGSSLRRDTADKIEAVLADSRGMLRIPCGAITVINQLELAGQWNNTGPWAERRHALKVGQQVRIVDGPFAQFAACVDAVTSETRIRALVDLFGRPTAVELDACQVEES